MQRLTGLALAALLALAVTGCSSDDDGEAADPDQAATTEETEADGSATSETTVVLNPSTSVTIETPFSIPPLDTDEVDVMIDEAFEDDEFTEDEIRAVLETAGMEPDVAACEAELLAELGVEEINGGQELLDAVQAMTPDQRARLDQCLG